MIERALKLLRTIEGGFVNDPHDKGGATNHGMSIRAVADLDSRNKLPEFLKKQLDVDSDGDIDDADVEGWTWEAACAFYKQFYWDEISLDQMPFAVALVMFDSAVNEGPHVAVQHFQHAMSLSPDGLIGPKTIAAGMRLGLSESELESFLVLFAVQRLDRYRHLEDADRYFQGWANRAVLVSLDALKEGLHA